MKKTFSTVLLLLLISCSQAVEAKSKFDHLRTWAGKYPTYAIMEKPGDAHKLPLSFFALPELGPALTHLLSKQDFKLLTKEYSVENPIELIGDYLCLSRCRPHNCAAENAELAFDLRDGSIYVMMYLWDDKGKNARWFCSRGSQKDLPEAVLNFMKQNT